MAYPGCKLDMNDLYTSRLRLLCATLGNTIKED